MFLIGDTVQIKTNSVVGEITDIDYSKKGDPVYLVHSQGKQYLTEDKDLTFIPDEYKE